MKKRILKFLAGTAAVAAMIGGMTLPVLAAPTEVTDVTKMENSYYRTLTGKNDEKLKGNPSLTIEKYKNGSNPSEGIADVVFKYAKVGDLYQIIKGNEVSMAFGVDANFATQFSIQGAADYYSGENDEKIYYYKDINAINTEHLQKIDLQSTTYASVKDYVKDFDAVSTKADGTIKISNVDYGLYVLAEWDVSHATIDGKPVSLTNTQSPFLVALPTSVTENGVTYWNENVKARIKNSSDEAEVEKKIVTDKETLTTGDETVDDTDTTSIGDIVHFRLKGTVPTIPKVDNGNQQKFNKYVLVDNLSKGLTPETTTVNGTVQLKDVVVRTTNVNADYTLAAGDYTITITDYEGNEAEYAGGKTITVTLTDSGLTKISKWAADTNEKDPKEIYFYYTAVVNEKAEIGPNNQTSGPAGNPNEVQLRYKIGTSADMETEWDKVTEYTFGIDANKQLAGEAKAITDDNKENITFVLYSTKSGTADASDKTYYEMENVYEETEEGRKAVDGVYHVTKNTKTSVTDNAKMHPAAGGALKIKGLEEGTYFLEELSTVSGYNILKAPVKIEITANKGENTYVRTDEQYIGTISQEGNTDGIFKVTINNTKGFELPSTGGNGIWFFVLAGAFVVAAGCGYYSMTIRKNRAK